MTPNGLDLDTFALQFNNGAPTAPGVSVAFFDILRRQTGFGSQGGSIAYEEHFYILNEDGSLYLEFDYFPPPDYTFDAWNHRPNQFDKFYRLKFEGYLPEGFESDSLYATIHYLILEEDLHEKVRDPISFTMFKAK